MHVLNTRRCTSPRFFTATIVAFLMIPAVLPASKLQAGDALDAMRASFRLTDGGTSGTCFVVRGDEGAILVTAAHVMNDMKRDVCRLILRTRKEDGSYERTETPVRIRIDGKPQWRQHATADLAVMKFAFPSGVDIKPFELSQVNSRKLLEAKHVTVGDNCFVPCFPVKIEADAAGWPVLRRGSIASYPLRGASRASTFLLDYNNFGGDSGAAVVTRPTGPGAPESQIVIGVVVGNHRQTDRTRTTYEERTTHHPLNLAICVHAYLIHELLSQ